MHKNKWQWLMAGPMCWSLAACTHNVVVLKQPKPMVVDVNLNGKLTLVVQSAKKDMDYIAGGPPPASVVVKQVTPAGTRPARTTGTQTAPTTRGGLPHAQMLLRTPGVRIETFDIVDGTQWRGARRPVALASKHQLLRQLKQDFPRIKRLLDAHLVGESHRGLVSPRKTLTAAQQGLVSHENALRRALYALVAAKKGQSVKQVALAFFVARLPYIKAGDWVQRLNKTTGAWDWVHWHG